MLDPIKKDIAFALRMLWKQPGFTAVALIALALGVGANTAIFSVVNTVLWRPLPYPDSAQIMFVAEQRPREGRMFGPVSPADYFDWRRENHSFSDMAAYMGTTWNMTGVGEPDRLRGVLASPGFLRVLGLMPAQGRDFQPEEETFGRHRVVLLTDSVWRSRFGGDPQAVGRKLSLDGNDYEIIGVLPPGLWWKTPFDILTPLALSDRDRTLRGAHFLEIVARLLPEVSMLRAKEDLAAIGARLSEAYPDNNTGHGPNLRSLHETLVGDVRGALLVLLAAATLVLLIACANVATLLLARASVRQRELSVRRAVGASRSRLVQQMLTESLVVSFAGSAAGIALAASGLTTFRKLMQAQFSGLPNLDKLAIDFPVLVAAVALTIVTGLVFGAVPAFMSSSQNVSAALNEDGRGASGGRQTLRLRSGLVVAELALSVILLVGASLLILSFYRLTNVSPGFRSDEITAAEIALPSRRYPNAARAVQFYQDLYARLRATPGVKAVAATAALPFSGEDSRLDLEFENRTFESQTPIRAHPRMVSTDYLNAMGIPLIRGRQFTERDNGSRDVVIINEAAARAYWPGEDPIGQRISFGSPRRWLEIIGIAGDVRHFGLEKDPEPEAYIPQLQGFDSLGSGFGLGMTVVIRSSSDIGTIAPFLRAAVRELDPQQPVGSMVRLDDMIAESVAPRRLNFILVSVFAVLAVVLTAAGLYGVMSYIVTQRTREIGVRMALGATRRQVLAMVVRQVGTIATIGIGVGVAGALLLTRWISSMLFGIDPADPVVYAGVAILLAVVALLAAAIPSGRASRIDPLRALRES